MKQKFLNSKELKPIRKFLSEQFGFEEKLHYVFSITEKGDVYIINESMKEIDLSLLRTHTIGIYFGEWKKGQFRPSIEGSQIIGSQCTKNVYGVDEKLEKMWMYGLDIPHKGKTEGFVLVKGRDFLGSGRVKEDKVLNHVPKGRRIHE